MRQRLRLRPAASRAGLLAVLALSPSEVMAQDDPVWEPGRRISRLEGEVRSPEHRYGTDGVYDRFDGDVAFALGLGAEVGGPVRGAIVARALYYYTAGIVLSYTDSMDDDAAVRRVLTPAIEVRPLFLPRWSEDKQIGLPHLDLMLDSLAVSVGPYFAQVEDGGFGDYVGVEAALGFGVPILASARGPWIEARATYRSDFAETDVGCVFLLSWYEAWLSPILE